MSNVQPIIDQIAAPLLGRSVVAAERGLGSFVSIDFAPVPDGASRSAWHLWIYQTDWRLEGPAGVTVGSGDAEAAIDDRIRSLEGRALEAITVDNGDTAFAFTDGRTLRTMSTASVGDEEWMLFTPEGNVLSVGPGERWTYEPAGST